MIRWRCETDIVIGMGWAWWASFAGSSFLFSSVEKGPPRLSLFFGRDAWYGTAWHFRTRAPAFGYVH